MKKILLIANYKSGVGGIAVQLELLYRKLNEERINSDIFSTQGTWFYRFFVLFKLILKGKKYDVFYIHGCSYFGGFFPIIIGVTVGKMLRKKIIVTYHGGDAESFFKNSKSLVRFFLTKTDVNIVLSKFLGEIFSKFSIPFIIIPNIVEFSSEQFVLRNVIQPNYISVRALTKTYNIDCILKAFFIVQQKLPEAKLIILGDGECRAELENLAKNLNLQNIHFVGRVNNDEIYNYLSKTDVFVSSPVIDNQPMSILEAYNAGLLVISSKVGGVPYMLEDRKTGLLFESDNENELAEKMFLAVEKPEITKKIIRQANKELEKYSWDKIKHKLLTIILE